MDKNTWIGFLLIAAIIVGFTMLNRPSKEELAHRQHVQDSINAARLLEAETQRISDSLQMVVAQTQQSETIVTEEQIQERLQAAYGTFAPAAQGEEKYITLSNEHLKLTLSTLGGRIERAELLEYHASGDSINPLCLFRADESAFGLTLITANNRILQTANLYFTPVKSEEPNKAILRLPTSAPDAYIDFIYELSEDYMVHLSVAPHNMQTELAQNVNSLELQWRQLIPQQEQGRKFEERYAQLQYMLVGGEMEDTKTNSSQPSSSQTMRSPRRSSTRPYKANTPATSRSTPRRPLYRLTSLARPRQVSVSTAVQIITTRSKRTTKAKRKRIVCISTNWYR